MAPWAQKRWQKLNEKKNARKTPDQLGPVRKHKQLRRTAWGRYMGTILPLYSSVLPTLTALIVSLPGSGIYPATPYGGGPNIISHGFPDQHSRAGCILDLCVSIAWSARVHLHTVGFKEVAGPWSVAGFPISRRAVVNVLFICTVI